ncbi:unnamed protein product, partial [marine sediment metagenome]
SGNMSKHITSEVIHGMLGGIVYGKYLKIIKDKLGCDY